MGSATLPPREEIAGVNLNLFFCVDPGVDDPALFVVFLGVFSQTSFICNDINEMSYNRK